MAVKQKKKGKSKTYQIGDGKVFGSGFHGTAKDKKVKALHPGRRVSKTGKKYTERRVNRSDKDRRVRL